MEQKIEQLKEIVREIELRVSAYNELKSDNVKLQREIDDLKQKINAVKSIC